MASRGQHLLHADRRFATASGLLARVAAPAAAHILSHIDRGLERGGIVLTMPGGKDRRVGFRAPGPEAAVRLGSWMALVRLALSGSVTPKLAADKVTVSPSFKVRLALLITGASLTPV